MKKIIILVFTLLLITGSMSAMAHSGHDDDDENRSADLHFIDPKSITDEGEFRKAWVRVKYKKEQQIPGGKMAAEYRVLLSFHCEKKTIATIESVFYDKDGKFLQAMKNPNSSRKKIKPGSMDESLYQYVCNKQKQ